MIAKTSKSGKGFSGVLSYCLESGKKPEILAQNHCFGDTPQELAWQFRDVANLNVNVKNPVFHGSLSFPEEISPEKMGIIAKDFLKQMGFTENSQYMLIKHNDHDNYQHVHIVANRVDLDGKAWKDSFSQKKAVTVAKEIETKYSLTKVESIHKGFTNGNPKENFQDIPIDNIRMCIIAAQSGAKSLEDFIERMRTWNVEAIKFQRTNGEVYGLGYRFEGNYYTSKELGNKFRFANFLKDSPWVYEEEERKKYQEQIKASQSQNENKQGNTQELRNNQNVGLKRANNNDLSL